MSFLHCSLRVPIISTNCCWLMDVEELLEALKIEFSQRGSQYSPLIEADILQLGARVNTKGSNVETGVNPSGEEDVANVIPTMGLFVQCDCGT